VCEGSASTLRQAAAKAGVGRGNRSVDARYSAPYIFLRSRRRFLALGCLWINKIAFPSADSTAHNI
jgi:hypothetical protein